MKLKINIFTALTVFAALFSVFSGCQITNAQTPVNKKQTKKEKLEEKEVRRFADLFIQGFEETKDLNQIPERFFVADFKVRLAKNNSWVLYHDNSEWSNSLNDDEKYNNNISIINFFNLLGIVATKSHKSNAENEDLDDEDLMKKSLPPPILELFIRSRWLRGFIDENAEDESGEPENLIDNRSFIADINVASDAFRMEVNKSRLKFPDDSETSKYFSGLVCRGERCLGLPENTTIFAIHKYLMCLRIIKLNDELKIADIYSVIEEN